MTWAGRNPWVWSAAAVAGLWVVLSLLTDRVSLDSLSGVAMSASFLAIAALGQMLVVTTGRGHVDLSIPSVLTLSAFTGLILVRGDDQRLPLAVAAVAAIGVVTGGVNAALVLRARIPAIMATLATGYILATATLLANRDTGGASVSPLLRQVAVGRIAGVPGIVLIAAALAATAAWLLGRSAYGRMLSAVGQNARAAALAGIPADAVTAAAFVLSSLLAAFDGMLLGGYVGGAFLEMGGPYLLQSLGAVVLGGSLILGGASTALGTLFGSLLLVLIVTTLQIAGLPPGTQDIVQGAVIMAVLALAGGSAWRRRRPASKGQP